ncbi:hypothetical protein C7960_2157, partial [Methanohalophilus euhalobius]
MQEFQQKSATNEDEIDNVLARPVLMLNPWEHQKEGLNSWLSNKGFGILEMATATGKTVVGLMRSKNYWKNMEGYMLGYLLIA